jgi:hypothetical protein
LTLIGPYTSLGGIFQGPVWYYLLSVPIFLTGGNPAGTVYLMLLFSLAVLFIIYRFLDRYFGITCAIIGLLLFAFSPEATAAATYSWNPHPMWLIITVYIIILFKLIQTGNPKMHLLLWPVVLLMFNFEAALGVFILLSTLIYLAVKLKKGLFNRYFFRGLLLSGLFILPLILFDIRHGLLMTKSVISLSTGNSRGLFAGNEYQGRLNLIASNLLTLWFNLTSGFYLTKINLPYLDKIFPGLFLAGLVTVIFRKFRQIYQENELIILDMLYSICGLILTLTLLYPFPMRYWFLTGFQSLYLVIIAVLCNRLWRIRYGQILVAGLFIPVIWYGWINLDKLYISPPNDGGTAKIKGKLAAVDYIYHDARGEKFGAMVFTPPVNTDAYDYLFWWRGKQKFGYMPYNEKKGLVYLLIEPDGDKPWSYKGWLETVVKDGEILKTVTLPSGFIIQKRRYP